MPVVQESTARVVVHVQCGRHCYKVDSVVRLPSLHGVKQDIPLPPSSSTTIYDRIFHSSFLFLSNDGAATCRNLANDVVITIGDATDFGRDIVA